VTRGLGGLGERWLPMRQVMNLNEGGQVRKRYGVPAVLGLLPGRVTYVIDRQGMVRHVFNSMTNISQHVDDALEVVRQLQAEQRA
jgi:peroxiredoxin Q/BCP